MAETANAHTDGKAAPGSRELLERVAAAFGKDFTVKHDGGIRWRIGRGKRWATVYIQQLPDAKAAREILDADDPPDPVKRAIAQNDLDTIRANEQLIAATIYAEVLAPE